MMRQADFISAGIVRRFNRVMELSGFHPYNAGGQGAYVANIISRYPGYRAEVAAALDKARNLRQPEGDLDALDAIDIMHAPEIV